MTPLATKRPLHFPPSFAENEVGLIEPRSPADAEHFVNSVAPDDALLLATRLLRSARKRREERRYTLVNRQRLEVARDLIERVLAQPA